MMETSEILGSRIKQRREHLGYTQQKLAELCGISQSSLSRIELGSAAQLGASTLTRIADVLRSSLDFLTGKTDDFRIKEVVEADPDAHYLFQTYRELSAPQAEQLILLADFLRYGKVRFRVARSKFMKLYQFCERAISEGKWDENDPSFVEAGEFVTQLILWQAEDEVREEEGNGGQGS